MYICPFCQQDTGGNHSIDCPINPININNKQCSILKDVNITYSDNTCPIKRCKYNNVYPNCDCCL
jgi:hypothetical protein